MKKIISFLIFGCGVLSFSQTTPSTNPAITGGGSEQYLTPDGLLDNVFDHYGKQYKLSDLKIVTPKPVSSKVLAAPITTAPLVAGYYKLFFETGCGFENDSDPAVNATNNARRLVLKQVFEDLSAFINSPLTASGNKVNIWVRSVSAFTANPAQSNILGLATSFFNVPASNSGNIADNELWKTIHLGYDSYANSPFPQLQPQPFATFYHGLISFNFSNSSTVWNSNLSIVAPTNTYDLYSVILHEITHALGFASLIRSDGIGLISEPYNNPSYFRYYSRYDRYLKSGSQPLISNGTNTCSMYNYTFNPLLLDSLHPGCPDSVAPTDELTNCATAINYQSAINNVAVYRPTCFQNGSSLSHFEDHCYINTQTGLPYGNNLYFNMSNANGTGTAFTKRFLKPEERNVLNDLGYTVNSTYGNTAQFSYKNYGGNILNGINVAGSNDGFDGNRMVYIVEPSQILTIPGFTTSTLNGFLSNDTSNVTSFTCLKNYSSTSIINKVGNNITFQSSIVGTHLLSYVPVNANNQAGNITYLYVYVQEHFYNGTPENNCNLVVNGNFEQHTSLPTSQSQFNGIVSGWKTIWTNSNQSNEYFHTDVIPPTNSNFNNNLPCNTYGYESDKVLGNKGYVGMFLNRKNNTALIYNEYSEIIKTRLKSSLLPNSIYTLTFDISLSDSSTRASKIQAYVSTQDLVLGRYNNGIIDCNIALTDPIGILKSNTTFSTSKNGWERVTLVFNTGAVAGQQYLYLGGITNNIGATNLNVTTGLQFIPPTCNNTYINNNDHPYYYLDNVELVTGTPISPTITGSTSACLTLPNANTTSNSTTLLSGQTAAWSITGGTGTLTGANTTTANVTWATLPGTLTLTITDTATGCTKSTTRIITSDCLPYFCVQNNVFTEITLVNGQGVGITSNSNDDSCDGLVNYSWNWGDGVTSYGQQGYHCYSTGGIKNVTITATFNNCIQTYNFIINGRTCDNGTGSSSNSRTVNTNNTNVKSKENTIDLRSNFSISPNPSKGIFTLKTQDVTGLTTIIVTDINGRLVYESKEILENEKTIDLSKFQSGVYILNAIGENIDFTEKLIKK